MAPMTIPLVGTVILGKVDVVEDVEEEVVDEDVAVEDEVGVEDEEEAMQRGRKTTPLVKPLAHRMEASKIIRAKLSNPKVQAP